MNVVILSRRYRTETNKCGRETSEKDDSNLFYPDNRTIARDIVALNLSKVFFTLETARGDVLTLACSKGQRSSRIRLVTNSGLTLSRSLQQGMAAKIS